MRYLEQSESLQVSGGIPPGGSYSSEYWQMLHEDAHHEGMMDAVIGGAFGVGISMFVISGWAIPVTAPVVIAAGALSLCVANTFYNIGYTKYEFWPWN